ncbi:MAG: GNAT family N-acetyltransferase [Chloroflexota bacterium]|nr:GNAT family N-acetyltransferase [Chloroflexota bacterium]
MNIKYITSASEKAELDYLLWSVLWKPFDLPRNVRESFELGKPQIELIAVDRGSMIGGLVANQGSGGEMEIHHIAVEPQHQGRSVGTSLVNELIGMARENGQGRIQTWARSTAFDFYTKLGFIPTGRYVEHEVFIKHGITVQQMYLEVPLIADSVVPPSGFSERLVTCNGLDRSKFARWAFHPGMLFGATMRWWGDEKSRERPHEGLDICMYGDEYGQVHNLDERTQIPVMYDGEIVKIDDDLLGKSVFVRHGIHHGDGKQLYSVYAHTTPHNEAHEGKFLSEGDVVATIADTRNKKVTIAPHLHLSIAWIPTSLPHERLTWETMNDPDTVVLLDPLKIISCNHSSIEHT